MSNSIDATKTAGEKQKLAEFFWAGFDAGTDRKTTINKNEAERQLGRLMMETQGILPDDIRWIVNDSGELGVQIYGRCFFLYKGASLEYGDGLRDDGTHMLFRQVGKREFGETQWPAKWLRAGRSEDKYTEECTYHAGLSDGQPDNPDYQWKPLPVISEP